MDLRGEYQALRNEVSSGRFAQAVATADRLIAFAGDWDDPQADLLIGGVMMMRLGVRAQLEPGEAVVADCEAVFARFRDSSAPAAALIALSALKTELELLLRDDPQDERIDGVVQHLASLYAAARQHPNQHAIATPLLSSIDWLTGRGHASQALQLARGIVARLASSEDDDERRAAAVAQLWVVIATTYGGERFTSTGDVADLDELFSEMLHRTEREQGELSGVFGAMSREFDRCCDLGQIGVDAADSLLADFNTRDGWTQARLVTWMIKLSVLERLGRTEEAEHAIREVVALTEGVHLPGIDQAVAELRAKLS